MVKKSSPNPKDTSAARSAAEEVEVIKENEYVTSQVFPVGNNPKQRRHSGLKSMLLPRSYRILKYDVINGRGRRSYNHIGNRRYQESQSKMEKSTIVHGVVKAQRDCCQIGGFLKKKPGVDQWISIGGSEATEKVGHCLRDMIAAIRKEEPKQDSWRQPNLAIRRHSEAGSSQSEVEITAPIAPAEATEDPNALNMSDEQMQIIQILEKGFDGTVDQLFDKIQR